MWDYIVVDNTKDKDERTVMITDSIRMSIKTAGEVIAQRLKPVLGTRTEEETKLRTDLKYIRTKMFKEIAKVYRELEIGERGDVTTPCGYITIVSRRY